MHGDGSIQFLQAGVCGRLYPRRPPPTFQALPLFRRGGRQQEGSEVRHKISQKAVSIIAAVAMAALLVPVAPAPVVLAAEGTVAPSKAAVTKAVVALDSVRIMVLDMPQDVVGIDIYRSTAAGELGDKLNDEVLIGATYRDAEIEPETTYYYTVQVAKRDSKVNAGRFTMRDVMPQISVTTRAASEPSAPAPAPVRPEFPEGTPPVAASSYAAPASAGQIAAMSTVVSGAGETTTLATNTTWTTAMSPIFIRGDVTVPAGKSLTIQPGVKVYFDTVASGASQSTTQDPTSKVDLIVHGKLVAKGTSTAPIVLTSIHSLPSSATVSLPQAADWGAIFTDSRAASEISNCLIQYGSGCWSYETSRPYYTGNTIQECGMFGQFRGGIVFEQPTADAVTPRIIVSGNTISGNERGISIQLCDRDGDMTVDPYIAGNAIKTDGGGIHLTVSDSEDTSRSGGAYVKGTIVGNNIQGGEDEHPVLLWADAKGAQTARVSTAFSGNTVKCTADTAVYVSASSPLGKAYASPTFSGDKIRSAAEAFYAYVDSTESTASAAGGAYVTPRFTNCQISSLGNHAVTLCAVSENAGPATTDAVFTGGSLENVEESGVWASATSVYGNASASPTFTNVNAEAHNAGENLVLSSSAKGLAKTSPKWVGGDLINYGSCNGRFEARSDSSTAEVRPYVSGATVQGFDGCFQLHARSACSLADQGRADVSGTFTDSVFRLANYDDFGGNGYPALFDCQAQGVQEADAHASPTFVDCWISSSLRTAIGAVADSENGRADASPVVRSTFIQAVDAGVFASATRTNGGSLVPQDAIASPEITDSTVVGTKNDAVSLCAASYGVGDALAEPVITGSHLENLRDLGALGATAFKSLGATGTARFNPTVDGSTLVGRGAQTVAPFVVGPGEVSGGGSRAVCGGTFTNAVLDNDFYDCFYGETQNSGGSAEFTPHFEDCALRSADDHAVDHRIYNREAGTSALTAPTFVRTDMTQSCDGILLRTEGQGSVKQSPILRDSAVWSDRGTALTTVAQAFGTAAVVSDALVYNTELRGSTAAVECVTGACGDGDAVSTSRFIGKSASARSVAEGCQGYGIKNSTLSLGAGDVVDLSQVKYLDINSAAEAVQCEAMAIGGSAVTSQSIVGNFTDAEWSAAYRGVSLVTSGRDTTVTPLVSANTVRAASSSGVFVSNTAARIAEFNPVVTGNTIANGTLGIDGNGITIVDDSASMTAASKVTVTRNTISRPGGSGIEIIDVPFGLVEANKISFPGFGNSSIVVADSAGVFWSGAAANLSPLGAQVRGNMITDARNGVYYEDGRATTQYNSFGDAFGRTCMPWTLGTNSINPSPTVDARLNWWGTSSLSAIEDSINGSKPTSSVVDFSSPLMSRQPKVRSISKSKSRSTYTFRVTFDRPMDTSVKYLRFGTRSPYTKYKTKTGTWNAAGTVLTVKYTGTLSSGKYYFYGAKDLPGNLMLSSSKYFRL